MEQIETLNQIKSKREIRVNLRLFNKILLILVIASFVYYLTGTNSLAVKGFAIRDLKAETSQLHEENVNLEIKTTSLSSYNQLSERVNELELVSANNIKYVSIETPVVAKK